MKEFADIFKDVLMDKYALFTGRAGRKEYWSFWLICVAISLVLMIVEGAVGSNGILGGIFGLATFIPSIAVLIRRLHDTDRSGWWALLLIVPLANIAIIVFMFLQGTVGDNRFGSDPKRIS